MALYVDPSEKRDGEDVEHGKATIVSEQEIEASPVRRGSVVPADEVTRARDIQNGFAPIRFLSQSEKWLDKKLGIETQGIDRIPEEEKKPPSIFNIFWLWWSLDCHPGALALGFLGPEFGLTLKESVSAIIVGTFLGSLCTGYCGTLGPRTGLRAMATARYSFGYAGAKLCSILNVIIGVGFAVVNIVITGQMLSAVSDYRMTISVGCIIVAVLSYVISVFGFAIIHTFEKYSWISCFILFVVLVAQAASHLSSSAVDPEFPTHTAFVGTWLSFMAINFSSASGWCSIAADYYCNYPAKTSSWKVFNLTVWGITIPTSFGVIIGAVLGDAALLTKYPPYELAYKEHGLGGLIREIYHPTGFSKFALVLLTFSVLGNNVATNYSSGLSLQLLGHYFHAVPRFIWSFLCALVAAVLAVVGKDNLSAIVADFVSLLGYWTISFTMIVLIEDKWFRRHEGYNLEAWNQPNKLPLGAAAVTSLITSYLAGGLPGMAQAWYVGPVAAKFGPYGGDVGIYMSGIITIICYPGLRFLEKKYTGR